MPLIDKVKRFVDRPAFRPALVPLVSSLARLQKNGVQSIFYEDGTWIHETSAGYFVYRQPFVRLDLVQMDQLARANFFWGCSLCPGDVVIDVGAGVGEEALALCSAVGPRGKVISIEAHPRTFRCLEKLAQYNRLQNLIPVHAAVSENSNQTAMIEDSTAYLTNRLNRRKGVPVRTITIDEIHRKLQLRRVQFLKMNIEGAERGAIRGMRDTLRQTEVMCICCHDFLAAKTGDTTLNTKVEVREFLAESGFRIVERQETGLPPYLRDQVWAYNDRLLSARRVAG